MVGDFPEILISVSAWRLHGVAKVVWRGNVRSVRHGRLRAALIQRPAGELLLSYAANYTLAADH